MQRFRTLVLTSLAVVAMAVWAFPAFAQSQDGGVGVGVVGGISRAKLTAESLDEFTDSRTGTMLGLWVGGNRNGVVGFVGEFMYVWRKTDINGDADGGELKYPAVEIPAVFHINFGSADRNKGVGRIIVGPVFTLNLAQKLDGVEIEDDFFKGADIGIMAGGGFEIFRVGFEVRGNWGLRNISTEGELIENDIKTRSVEFVVKFRFN
jgi:hypothetical protein